mmetsp:Transcript_8165/g.17593  ORF Transcript_8165/g.17593 Transcript_8165/m.17593 type:complete len:200 (+) Transcript_8165:372-971(+)
MRAQQRFQHPRLSFYSPLRSSTRTTFLKSMLRAHLTLLAAATISCMRLHSLRTRANGLFCTTWRFAAHKQLLQLFSTSQRLDWKDRCHESELFASDAEKFSIRRLVFSSRSIVDFLSSRLRKYFSRRRKRRLPCFSSSSFSSTSFALSRASLPLSITPLSALLSAPFCSTAFSVRRASLALRTARCLPISTICFLLLQF